MNSSAKLNIPQPGGHIEPVTNSSIFQVRPVEQMWRICGFTLTPSSGIRPDSFRTSLRDGGTTARPHHVRHPPCLVPVRSSFGNALVGEFLVSFLLVFTVFRTAVNSDSFTRRR